MDQNHSNLPVQDRNIIHAFAGVADGETLDECETLYLRGRDRDASLAEHMALEWAWLSAQVTPMIRAAERIHDGQDHGVRAFLRERHYRSHFPDGRRS